MIYPLLGFLEINWHDVFTPSVPIAEIILRGSIIYLTLFTLLNFISKRQAGSIGITDLLVIVLLADAAQNGMAGGYESVTEAIILVSTIIFWNHTLNWIGYKFPQIQFFVYPPPLTLIKQGRLLHHNLKRELITEEELMSQLRQQGVKAVSEVQVAYLESDGHISVITNQSQQKSSSRRGQHQRPL